MPRHLSLYELPLVASLAAAARPKKNGLLHGVLSAMALAVLGCSAGVVTGSPDPVSSCEGGDLQCSPECGAPDAGCGPDQDAGSVACGDGAVAADETCDTGITSGTGACPTSCATPTNACATSVLKHAGTCTAVCETAPVTTCVDGDGCCPAGCTASTDHDCAGCGDGKVAVSEACDTAISEGTGACPVSCPSSTDACAPNTLKNAGTCAAVCEPTAITSCAGGDGCCPAGCTTANDSDCAGCGDGKVAGGEACDTAITSGPGACPSSCSASTDACNPSVLKNAGTCAAACVAAPVTSCVNHDGCCPAGCTYASGDTDCSNLPIDTSGTWAIKISAPGRIKTVSTLGITLVDCDVTITAWIRDSVTTDGTITHRICKMTTEGPTMKNTYSQALFDTLVTTMPQARETQLPIGAAVTLPAFTIHSGQDSVTPKPNSIDAVPVGDGDGHPGVTVRSWTQTFNTTLDAYLGLILTSTTSNVILRDATTMTGMTSFGSKGYVFDSSASLLVGPASTIDQTTTAAQVAFTAKKLDSDGSHDCAYITSNL